MHDLPRLLVLYGSETGNARDVAEYVQQLAIARRLGDTQVCALDEFPVAQLLPQCATVVFVVSTTGDGEAPENMRLTWRSLLRKTLPRDWLDSVDVAVFGLGDSSYAKYNAVARKLQARLVQLGAHELVPRGLGDDQHAFGYFGALTPWLTKLWDAVLMKHPLPRDFVVDDTPQPLAPRFSVVYHSDTIDTTAIATPRTDTSTFYAPPRTALAPQNGIHLARLVENTRLTAADWTQDVRHVVLTLDDDGASTDFRAGAVADVYAENTSGVDEMLAYVSRSFDASMGSLPAIGARVVTIHAADGSPQDAFPSPTTLHDVFTKYLDVLGTPRRSFFAHLARFAVDIEEKDKLVELASPEGVDLLYDYCIREKKTYAEVLGDFPSAIVPLAMLLQLLPRLRPRSYSIASSSMRHPKQVHLAVAVVDFVTPYKRRRTGVCSAYLQSLSLSSSCDNRVPLWIKAGVLTPSPRRDQSLLLIGPGTGLASMRALIQERSVLRANASNAPDADKMGDTVLFFGSRHEHKDFLYGDELRRYVASGDLTALHTAFSRDQSHKIYVQTRLAENKDAVCALLLASDSVVYIAGSAKRMPSDVFDVLRDILRSVGGLSLAAADAHLKTMVRLKRYVVESWS